MAQGLVKQKAKAKPKTAAKQHGARVIKPKKTALLQKQKTQKKHTSGLTALTEKSLAAKAGHLELLQGGRSKGSSADDKLKNKPQGRAGKKGTER